MPMRTSALFAILISISRIAGAQTAREIYNFHTGPQTSILSVAVAASGVIYGSTLGIYNVNAGSVFELVPDAKGGFVESVIHTFALSDGSAFGSCYPVIVASTNGDLYGTAVSNGAFGMGSVFRLSPPASGGSWTYSTLYSFTGGADSEQPVGGVVVGKNGQLFGATYGLGYPDTSVPGAYGSLYQLAPPVTQGDPWLLTTLYTFTGGQDGGNPFAGVTGGPGGALYGTTITSAPLYGGTVFQLTPPAHNAEPWTFAKLHQFGASSDGWDPLAPLAIAPNGSLFGTTYNGGTVQVGGYEGGTAFAMFPPSSSNPTWKYEVIHDFGAPGDCAFPILGVALGRGGVLFGINNVDNVDNVSCPAYTLTPPAQPGEPWTESFLPLPSLDPTANFVRGPSGNLFTATVSGGADNYGGVVEVIP